MYHVGYLGERKFGVKLSKTLRSEGFVTASLLFCVGAMAIMGALDSGLTGDHSTLYAKALLDGIISTPDLKDRLGSREVPEEDEDRYSTLSGMVMLLLGRVPREGDSVDWADWKFEVVDMDGRRIDKVLAIPLSGSKKTEESEGSSAS